MKVMVNNMRIIIFFLIIILDVSIYSTFLQNFTVLSVLPNTTLILVISYSLLRSDYESCIFGFTAGLMFDLFFSNYVGLLTLICTVIGFTVSRPFSNLYRDSYLPPIITVLIVSFFYELLFYFINIFIYDYISFLSYLYVIIFPTIIYSVVVTPFIFKFISTVNSLIEEREQHKRKVF